MNKSNLFCYIIKKNIWFFIGSNEKNIFKKWESNLATPSACTWELRNKRPTTLKLYNNHSSFLLFSSLLSISKTPKWQEENTVKHRFPMIPTTPTWRSHFFHSKEHTPTFSPSNPFSPSRTSTFFLDLCCPFSSFSLSNSTLRKPVATCSLLLLGFSLGGLRPLYHFRLLPCVRCFSSLSSESLLLIRLPTLTWMMLLLSFWEVSFSPSPLNATTFIEDWLWR